MRFTTLTLLAVLATNTAFAHSEPEMFTPADGSVVETAPEQIELRFNDGMRLTKVELVSAEENSVAVELGEQSGFVKEFALPVQIENPGIYRVDWRGLGADGHPMNGTFSFEVK